MSYTVTKYPQGTFCWADVFSADIEKTKKFMTSLMGWTSKDVPTEEGKPDYTMFSLDGQIVAGGAPAFMEGIPSFWSNYVAVEDVDAVTEKAKKLGATVTMEPMDVLESGRMATIQDPTGANLSLWQAKDHKGAEVVNKTGAMSWNELTTKDVKKAKEFYGKLFGWTFEPTTDSPVEYYVIKQPSGRMNGGMLQMTPEMGDMPSVWVPYFTVDDITAAIKKAKDLGGTVHMDPPTTAGAGQFTVVSDPTGAFFMLIEMSPETQPEEWEEQ